MSEKKCSKCKFMMWVDSGYSNYSVEETTLHCLKSAHPKMPKEITYTRTEKEKEAEVKFNAVAETCQFYCEGEGIGLDVDYEASEVPEAYTDDEEVRAAYRSYAATIVPPQYVIIKISCHYQGGPGYKGKLYSSYKAAAHALHELAEHNPGGFRVEVWRRH